MLQVSKIQREFVVKIDNEEIILKDKNNLTLENVKEHYSIQYPELLNATIENQGLVKGKQRFLFKTVAGTKG